MPIENPPRRAIFAEIETVIHALSLYGAAGIVAFGWAMGHFLGVPTAPWLPLWFCAALLIYNCDRLRHDPADLLNIPNRAAACASWRPAILATVICSALVLVGLPAWRQDWLTLHCVLAGAIVSLGYSIPTLGFRWKDVPLVKTFFAPTVVTLAIFAPAFLSSLAPWEGLREIFRALRLAEFDQQVHLLAAWAWLYLLFNMLLCDLRDRAGDARCGIRSIPVVVGEKGARALLWVLAVIGQVLLAALIHSRLIEDLPLAFLALLSGLCQACLLHATRYPRSERFYEWAVEGLLYLPALACVLSGAPLLSRGL